MSDHEQAGGGAPPDSSDAAATSAGIPPYISFQTLLTFFSELKTNGLPPQIDNSVLRRFSGGIQGQLKVALRYLGLVEGSKPTSKLADMVEAYETPQFEPLLANLLKEHYPFVFALDLMSATPTMFAESFKVTGAKEDVSRKCRTFFLHAAKRAGIALGQRILTGTAPRNGNGGGRRKSKATKEKPEPTQEGAQDGQGKPAQSDVGSGLLDKLLEKFPALDPTWPDDIKAKWFVSFEQFMKGATKAKG